MKKTMTVDERTLNSAKADADRVQDIAEKIAELVGKAQNIIDKWEWTNYLPENAYKISNEQQIEFAEACSTINNTL